MISRGFVFAALAATSLSVSVFAQPKQPSSARAVRAVQSAARSPDADFAAQPPRILWIRNDKTGQVVTPGATTGRKSADTPEPVTIFNNYDNPAGVAGINLEWNYPEAYSNKDFIPPPPPSDFLRFGLINIASDASDPDVQDDLYNGETLCLMFEPYHADTWPTSDLNDFQSISEYTSVVASYSEQFEIRICRIYFFSLEDVTQPFNPFNNRYNLDLQLSFAFVSFAYQTVESPFQFDLSGFDPPLTIKGDGLVLTHWMKLSLAPVCEGDLNEDGLVEDADFVLFLAQYNILDCADETMPEFCSADLNFDGFVDDSDFVIFLMGYNDLLCPAPYVIRKAYAPLAGGRYKWDNGPNLPIRDPISQAVPISDTAWPFPNALVTVPFLGSGPYTNPYGCDLIGCQPNFLTYFSSLTGFKHVSELNMDADDLKPEYERFLNEIAALPFEQALKPFWFFDPSTVGGSSQNTQWVSSATPKRISITPPPASK
ncbi:MAG: dockerin type I repeat-containing protein [Phycisphaeraceae bacterium]|nr:dockerin type I repeat-containing protein [Phycisphaeraceae bacterium]